jgi:hypothetical protein
VLVLFYDSPEMKIAAIALPLARQTDVAAVRDRVRPLHSTGTISTAIEGELPPPRDLRSLFGSLARGTRTPASVSWLHGLEIAALREPPIPNVGGFRCFWPPSPA